MLFFKRRAMSTAEKAKQITARDKWLRCPALHNRPNFNDKLLIHIPGENPISAKKQACRGNSVICYNAGMSGQRGFAMQIHERLLNTYGQPEWRNPLPPLDELVSTILSQNTNDENRDRAFQSLRARFPSWEAVRDAEPEAVIDAIRSAGLANQKGPRIQKALQSITEERGELSLEFLRGYPPEEAKEWLLRFNGVGPKTTAIVMLFSLDLPAFPVDTHIYRVTGRLGLRSSNSAEKAHDELGGLFPPSSYYAAHLNLIRHGREVCKARGPECEGCILNELCEYYRTLPESGAIA